MKIVVRDKNDDAWINLGNDRWANAMSILRGKEYAELFKYRMVEENYGPLTAEWETEE